MEEDERREAAIASVSCLNPKFTSSSAVSQARLSKFQELHKRRLQIKEKSKIKNKSKGRSTRSNKLEQKDNHAKTTEDNSNLVSLDTHQDVVPKDVVAQKASKKPQKLHWGLDTKERWERKSNM
ncbi:hypothetical protein L1987_36825 [Smallanthus sonchifolius]|uniref:Uncharacterized protein n=1 Tax=Smallanthus sonchifolius TaxID=185202 RepID=A0ACB9HFB3_9ASTR|nr:hypothetical protein L1987_36825 [Smallanthus sonchifolius]